MRRAARRTPPCAMQGPVRPKGALLIAASTTAITLLICGWFLLRGAGSPPASFIRPESLLALAALAVAAGLLAYAAHATAVGSRRDTERRFDGIIDSVADAILSIDAQQRVVLFNAAAERMFLIDATTALGQPLARFIPDRFREAHNSHVTRFRDTGVTKRRMGSLGALSALRANGEEFPIEASI